jgi:hypothetical protein
MSQLRTTIIHKTLVREVMNKRIIIGYSIQLVLLMALFISIALRLGFYETVGAFTVSAIITKLIVYAQELTRGG